MVAERCIFVSVSEAVTTPSSVLHPPLDFTTVKEQNGQTSIAYLLQCKADESV